MKHYSPTQVAKICKVPVINVYKWIERGTLHAERMTPNSKGKLFIAEVDIPTFLRIGYNQGASGWLNSHVIIHENKKAQHIHIINGEFTTLK